MLSLFSPSQIVVFCTSTSAETAKPIYRELNMRLMAIPRIASSGVQVVLGKTSVIRFSNDNILVKLEQPVDGCIVVIIHTQVPPVSDGLIELIALIDAVRNAGAADILLCFPYMPYSRSDRKDQPGVSTLGEVLPELINSREVRNVILFEPHDSHLKHYFHPAADEIRAIYLVADYINRVFREIPRNELVIAFADTGASKRYEDIPFILGLDRATIHKARIDNSEKPKFVGLEGNVRGRKVLLVDDEVLTGETSIGDLEKLTDDRIGGAQIVHLIAVHAPLSVLKHRRIVWREVIKRLQDSQFASITFTNSIPIGKKMRWCEGNGCNKFNVVSAYGLLGEAIKRRIVGEQMGELHTLEGVEIYR